MALNVKVGLIGVLDMLKFKNMFEANMMVNILETMMECAMNVQLKKPLAQHKLNAIYAMSKYCNAHTVVMFVRWVDVKRMNL